MRKRIASFLNNKFIEGGVFLTISNFLNGFLNYLFNSLSGKILGPEKYGEITALFSYLFITTVPMAVILTDILRRLGQAGENKFALVKMWEQWMMQKISRWRFIFIVYLLLSFPVAYITNLSLLFSFTLLLILLLSFISVFYTSTLLGLQLFLGYALVTFISTATKLFGPVFAYFDLDGLTSVAFFLVASTTALIIGGKMILKPELRKSKKTRPISNKRILHIFLNRPFIMTSLSLVSIMLLNNFDVIFVKRFFSSYQAGIYGAWNLYAKIIFYVFSPLTGLAFIYFTQKENTEKRKKMLLLIALGLFFAGIMLFIIYKYFASWIILLIFNENYLLIQNMLSLAALFGILYTFISVINGFFIAKNSFFSLIITFFIPFYIISLLLLGKSLETVMWINVFFSIFIAAIYSIASFLQKN